MTLVPCTSGIDVDSPCTREVDASFLLIIQYLYSVNDSGADMSVHMRICKVHVLTHYVDIHCEQCIKNILSTHTL